MAGCPKRRSLRPKAFGACCAACAAALALLAQAARPLLSDAHCLQWFVHVGWYWYAGQLAIEAGGGPEQQGSGLEVKAASDLRPFFAAIVLGRVHAPAKCFPVAGFLKSAFEGPEGRFCRRALDISMMSEGYEVTAERGAADAFVRACRAELGALEGEEKELLQPLLRGGGDIPRFRWGKLTPDDASVYSGLQLSIDSGALAERRPGAEAVLDKAYGGPKLPRSELEELLSASLRYSIGRAGLAGARSERELEARLPRAMEYWGQLDVRGMESVGSDLPAIGRALSRGELVRFDARALLPRAMFNVTAASLAEAEGEAAKRIAVLSEMPYLPRSLDFFARVMAEAKLPLGFSQTEARHLPGFVNLRRLPRFAEQLPDIPAALNLTDDVLHAVSILWLGCINAGAWEPSSFTGFHYDAQANAYVQLSGESDVAIVPPEYTDLVDWVGNKAPLALSVEMLRAGLEGSDILPKVPVILAHLRPGDGLTLPSRTFHYFMAQSTERVALNFFFHPRWRQMQFNSTDLTSRARAEKLAVDKVALLSAQRVWREMGKAVFTNSARFELI